MIDEVLVAMEHDYKAADCLLEARRLIRAECYDYLLLSAMLPARPGGTPLVSNAHRVLSELAAARNGQREPAIVLLPPEDGYPEPTKRAAVRMAHGFTSRGAADFIDKPFPTAGRTLDRVIEKVLAIANGTPKPEPARPAAPSGKAVRASDGTEDAGKWLTVTEAAALLVKDLPALDIRKARSRISTAAGRGEFKCAGTRKDRRIEPVSFDAWRLKQRDRDLDEEDDDP
jgi:hypothetical protein